MVTHLDVLLVMIMMSGKEAADESECGDEKGQNGENAAAAAVVNAAELAKAHWCGAIVVGRSHLL